MRKLVDFPKLQQRTETSDWACVSRMIINYYEKSELYDTDQSLANEYSTKTGENCDRDLNKLGSAPDILRLLGHDNKMHQEHFPGKKEIKTVIKAGIPVLALVTIKKPTSRNSKHESDHWVIIIGIKGDKLLVADPLNHEPIEVEYDFQEYKHSGYRNIYYWVRAYYVDSKNEENVELIAAL